MIRLAWSRLPSWKSLLSDTAVYCVLLGAADVFEQKLMESDLDLARSMRVTLSGCLIGPLNHFWYRLLDGRLGHSTATSVVCRKVLLDLVASPVFASTFVCSVALLEGRSAGEAAHEYCDKFWPIMQLDLMFWPPVQALNFYLLPPQFRVTYVATAMFFYNSFLTFIKHSTN